MLICPQLLVGTSRSSQFKWVHPSHLLRKATGTFYQWWHILQYLSSNLTFKDEIVVTRLVRLHFIQSTVTLSSVGKSERENESWDQRPNTTWVRNIIWSVNICAWVTSDSLVVQWRVHDQQRQYSHVTPASLIYVLIVLLCVNLSPLSPLHSGGHHCSQADKQEWR